MEIDERGDGRDVVKTTDTKLKRRYLNQADKQGDKGELQTTDCNDMMLLMRTGAWYIQLCTL